MLIHKWETVCKRQRGRPIHPMVHMPHLLSERQLISGTWVLVCPIRRRLGSFLTNVTQGLGYGPRQPLMGGGYRLKSEDCISSGSLCGGWLQVRPSQHWIAKSEERHVAFGTNCPSLHWSNFTRIWPTVGYHALNILVAHKLEHRDADGEELHSTGSLGCSKKEATGREQFCFINVVKNIWRRMSRLSPSTSSCSKAVRVGSPHTKSSDLPRTGAGALGFGNQRRIDHVLQLGPPQTNLTRPSMAAWQSLPYGWSSNKSWPKGWGDLLVSNATTYGDRRG